MKVNVTGKLKDKHFAAVFDTKTYEVDFNGEHYNSPSAAAVAAVGYAANGWRFWKNKAGETIEEAYRKNGEKVSAGGRPRRFKGEHRTILIQMPEELAVRFDATSDALMMSKSQFGQFIFEYWLRDAGLVQKKVRQHLTKAKV